MSEKKSKFDEGLVEDFVLKLGQEIEQQIAAFNQFAIVLAEYRKALRANGFTKDEAMFMTLHAQDNMILAGGSVNK